MRAVANDENKTPKSGNRTHCQEGGAPATNQLIDNKINSLCILLIQLPHYTNYNQMGAS